MRPAWVRIDHVGELAEGNHDSPRLSRLESRGDSPEYVVPVARDHAYGYALRLNRLEMPHSGLVGAPS